MTESLRSRLQPVQRRQVWQMIAVWIALVVGSVVGGLAALVWFLPRPNWIAAARAIDRHYQLKDRAESALDFARGQVPTDKQAFAELQLTDAMHYLSRVEPKVVTPFKSPRFLPGAVWVSALAVVMAVVPLHQDEAIAAPTGPDEQIVAQAEMIEDRLKELEEELNKDVDPELEQLLQELKQKANEMKEPDIDVKEALAKISEMQAAIQSAQSQASLEQVDQQLHEIGEAMASAKALEGAGQALVEGKYDKAAKELANLEGVEFDRKEARNTAEKLKKAARKSGDGADGGISDATAEMAEGIDEEDANKVKGAARQLGDKANKQARKKRINDLLNAELSSLNDAKSNPQKNSTAKGKKKEKSMNPSNNWGMSESGNIDGDPTSRDSAATREHVTGVASEGESEIETSSSSEGRQEGRRGYKDVYQKYKKMSEAVLESEQIPLGHRQTIRKYFESIRPQQDEQPTKK